MPTIILQFKVAEANLDELFEFQESLARGVEQNVSGFVDGNDVGKEVFNIYVIPNPGRLGPCMENVMMWLKAKRKLNKVVVAKVTATGNITVEHPRDFKDEFDYGI